MTIKQFFQRTILTLTVLLTAALTTLAQHDQQQGEVLIFNYFTSDTSQPGAQNTKITLTNTDPGHPVVAHVFFVDGATGTTVANTYLTIVAKGTIPFLVTDFAPNVTGFIVAVAVSEGSPDTLIGSAVITLASGHHCTLPAMAYRDTDSGKTSKLMLDMLPSPLADQRPLLVVNNLNDAVSISGIVRGSRGNGTFSLPFGGNLRQITRMLDDSFSVTPYLSSLIPTTEYFGWMEITGKANAGIVPNISGAVLYFSPNTGISPGSFTGAYNLRHIVTP